MASSHSDSARMEQIITEFFAKSLHIILESRSPYRSSRNFSGEQTFSSPSSSSSSSSSVRSRDKWFNLALRECPEALENLDLWRQSNLEPMIVDVILIKRSLDWDPVKFSAKPELIKNASSKDAYPNCWDFDNDDVGSSGKKEKIVERWVVQYEVKKSKDCQRGGKRSGSSVLSSFYKKSMLLIRSLYATVRLLPAYKIFRDLYLSGQIRSFSLAHRVSSFVEPFTRKEEAEMQRFGFTPVDTSCGRLCLSVQYRSSVSDISSEPSTPMSPQLIQDYVGSPLADPLKRFPSLPMTHGSPSSVPFSRRHSWSYDYRASPPNVSFSPSPTHSEPYASASNPTISRFPPPGLPPHPPDPLHAPKDIVSLDECCPSPIYLPSPSASPPIFIPESQLSKVLLRSESAPVNIPGLRFRNNPAIFKNQNLPLSPPLRGARHGALRPYKTLVLTQTDATCETVAHGKNDLRRPSRTASAELAFSSSFHDDLDETECPFNVEDDDMTDPGSRVESFGQKGHIREPLDRGAYPPVRKSTGAAVGALVDLLKKAPPLRQESSISAPTSQTSRVDTWSTSSPEPNQSSPEVPVNEFAPHVLASTICTSRTATDALEELQSYKEMKNMLLSQYEGPRNQASSTPAEDSALKFSH